MDQPILHGPLNTSKKPPKMLALLALILSLALPFILVKVFTHKHPNSLATDLHEELQEEQQETSISSALQSSSPKSQTDAKGQTQAGHTNPTQSPKAVAENPRKIIIARPGDTLTHIFIRVGLHTNTLQQILHDTSGAKLLGHIKTGQTIKFIIKNKRLIKMTLPLNATQYLTVTRARTQYQLTVHSRKTNSRPQILTATIHGSLYNSAARNQIPSELIRQMTKILAWDINFAKDIRDGDQFTISYNALFIKEKQVGVGDILAVSYQNKGHTFQAIRHTDRTGHSDYFTPNGTSLKKAFDRYPVQFSHISSTFSLSRYHPVLHYARPHKGVDLAARIGTPIRATADGRIEIIGRQGAYGNMIKIRHNKTYSTVYGHLLKFQKGLSKGSFVHIGQVIGYVGQSGLADGPHCHYEFRINDQPKNPTTVQLPRGFPLTGRELARFKANTAPLLAQMDAYTHQKRLIAQTKNPHRRIPS